MKRSLTIARIRGVPILIHWTFPLLFLFFWGALFLIGAPRAAYLYVSIVTILIFLFVLLHELAHVTTARAFGVGTRSITLFPLGGLSMLERLPERPGQEALVALAGPLLNIAAALLLVPLVLHYHGAEALLGVHFLRLDETTWAETLGGWILSLFWINALLGVFNLLPAIPLDGGRVMRASLATRLSYASATQVAAFVGRVFAIAFVVIGVFWNLLLALIGIFVFIGASSEERSAQLMKLFARLSARDAMRDVPRVSSHADHEALVALRDPVGREPVAVVDGEAFRGIIPHETLRFLQPRRDHVAADLVQKAPIVRPDDDLGSVLRHFAGGRADAVAVVAPPGAQEGPGSPGRYLGLVTTEDMEVAHRHLMRQEAERRAARRAARAARRAGTNDVPVAQGTRVARGETSEDAERWVPQERKP